MAEDCMRPGNAPAAGQSQVETSTHAVSVDDCYGGSGEGGDGVHQPLAHQGEAKRFGAI